jgi:hypothetical protein
MRKLLAIVAIIAATIVTPASQASANAPSTAPITVNVHAFTPEYVKAVQTCMGGNDAKQLQCQREIPDTGARCLRVEQWFADGTFKVIRNEC